MNIARNIQDIIINPKTLVVINHSGGKDSQAMYLLLKDIVPKDRLVVIHAHLPEVEWDNTEEFIRSTIVHDLYVVQANKTFFEMVERRFELRQDRPPFPSASTRQCTSDLKRAPIQKEIRRICNEKGFDMVLNCMGMRAQESPARAKKKTFKTNKTQTNSKRTFFEWLPIHDLTVEEVFKTIADHGQKPFWTYEAGMSRKSCCFCILANDNDLCIASKFKPKLLDKIDSYEKKYGFTYKMPKKGKEPLTLKQIIKNHEFNKN